MSIYSIMECIYGMKVYVGNAGGCTKLETGGLVVGQNGLACKVHECMRLGGSWLEYGSTNNCGSAQ